MKQFYSTAYLNTSKSLIKPFSLFTAVLFLVSHTAFAQKIKDETTFSKKPLQQSEEKSGALGVKSLIYPGSVQSFLPGTLVNWTAKLDKNKVLLNWTTTIEKNSVHFTIEKSFNGVDFTDAAVLFAAGNSNIRKQYAFTEKLSHNAKNIYYRLKMVDMDDNIRYSDIRVVRDNTPENVKLEVYPNPAANDLKLTISSAWVNEKLLIEVYNINGVLVSAKLNEKSRETETLSVKDLTRGMYIVKVSHGSESSVQRFLKK
jgi:hypothetical protein